MNRRTFIQSTTTVAAAAASISWQDAIAAEAPHWPIGCFNRAWGQWNYEVALDGAVASGYKLIGLLSAHPGEPFTTVAATPPYLDALKKRIASRGLAVNVTALRFGADKLAESMTEVRKQIENAARLDLKFMLTFGVDARAHYENYYRLMADAAPRAEKHGLQLVLKPHGGISASSEDILRCLEKVGHSNFKIWYDAGNIIYYTGKDPIAELEPIARYVTGLCAKDCTGPKGEVMSQFGSGKVDFKSLFTKLKAAGFNGPIMVEGTKVGATPEETTTNAQANREFLEKTMASV